MKTNPKTNRLNLHAQQLARGVADLGAALVRTIAALEPEHVANAVAARIASGEAPCLTIKWGEDRIELRVGLDGAGDVQPQVLYTADFAYAAPPAQQAEPLQPQ